MLYNKLKQVNNLQLTYEQDLFYFILRSKRIRCTFDHWNSHLQEIYVFMPKVCMLSVLFSFLFTAESEVSPDLCCIQVTQQMYITNLTFIQPHNFKSGHLLLKHVLAMLIYFLATQQNSICLVGR